MARSRYASTTGVPTGSSVAASAGLGVLAAIVGVLTTYVLVPADVRSAVGEDVASWKAVAWYYYNAHLVEIEVSGGADFGDFGSVSSGGTMDLIAQSETARVSLLYVVPPLVLVLVGAVLAYHLGATNVGAAVSVGAPVTLGYVIVMGLGAVVAETTSEAEFFGIEASGSMAPELVPAVVLGGLLYPLVFATAGAVVVAVLVRK
ncbi:hypothetical protein [Natrarchaeobaculum aegyptiacum]|uniref:DUF7978 domain-containing protein n=1 Tax=Natrarchaeobaculum aegyptiacum TaxID=745377 RepID=A0A2Z2HUR3_9EURY|nr:hypothetical protein [Natrarchaeobaculum aegyptiacum]ARS89895.1 hypothetical protein B1756_09215 [Natrarchaeobaculum aegyptiacum]